MLYDWGVNGINLAPISALLFICSVLLIDPCKDHGAAHLYLPIGLYIFCIMVGEELLKAYYGFCLAFLAFFSYGLALVSLSVLLLFDALLFVLRCHWFLRACYCSFVT